MTLGPNQKFPIKIKKLLSQKTPNFTGSSVIWHPRVISFRKNYLKRILSHDKSLHYKKRSNKIAWHVFCEITAKERKF